MFNWALVEGIAIIGMLLAQIAILVLSNAISQVTDKPFEDILSLDQLKGFLANSWAADSSQSTAEVQRCQESSPRAHALRIWDLLCASPLFHQIISRSYEQDGLPDAVKPRKTRRTTATTS